MRMETGSKGRIDTRKENIIYVGIDLHKETHTAVMLDCWNTKLGEITFGNKPSEFPRQVRKVSRFVTEDKTAVYGLENACGYGRALAVWYEAGYFLDSLQASIAEKSKKAYESLKSWFNKTFKGESGAGETRVVVLQ